MKILISNSLQDLQNRIILVAHSAQNIKTQSKTLQLINQ